MKTFLDDQFLLTNRFAEILYHEYAAPMPIIDYHNHLPPADIAADTNFENITQVWLNGDHYKWRAMRTNGVPEHFITGSAGDREKFKAWSATVPYTLRNPLYHWTHLELKRYFGVDGILSPATADTIFDTSSALLQQPDYSVRGLLSRMNVQVLCTTDDPLDDLMHHTALHHSDWHVKVYPAFRPDKAMQVDDQLGFNSYVDRLASVTQTDIRYYSDYIDALRKRHDYFVERGCRVSDHGLDEIYADDYTEAEVEVIFSKLRNGHPTDNTERRKFKSAMLYEFALWDHARGVIQQYHLGAFRNKNSRMMKIQGPDTGWDSTGDFRQGAALAKFLDRLDKEDKLAQTILYNLNPADNEVFATIIGNYNDGSIAGKIQWGSAWWFLDQKDGMTKQLNTLSNMGLISRFVGMITDSRSFLSFPRHEYFRRILCNLFGEDIANGELPNDIPWVGSVISDICYHNAARYFGWATDHHKKEKIHDEYVQS